MEKIKEFIENHIVDIVCITAFVFFVFGIWLLYTANRTANEYHNVRQSVERVEKGVDRAERRAGAAQAEIKNAQKHIQRADEVTGKLTERAKRNQAELDECERIADRMSERSERIQGIIRDVEAGNKADGTQTNRT